MRIKTASEEIKIELETAQADYAAGKEQAQKLDELLGYHCAPIEKNLFKRYRDLNSFKEQQFWYGLDIQSLQTPYSELAEMVQHLKPNPGELWLDLGAAYGRMGIVIGFLAPMVKFVGYEFVSERVNEGNRIYNNWKLPFSKLKQKDLASEQFQLEAADLYFLYDFGSKKDVYRILEQLKKISSAKPIRVIARGRGIKNWIYNDCPWLYDVKPQEHFHNWSLFYT